MNGHTMKQTKLNKQFLTTFSLCSLTGQKLNLRQFLKELKENSEKGRGWVEWYCFAKSLGLFIPRGQCVSGNVVRHQSKLRD